MGKAPAGARALGGDASLPKRPQPLVGDGVDARAVEGVGVLALLAGPIDVSAIEESAQPLVPVVRIAPEECGEPRLGEKCVAGQQLERVEAAWRERNLNRIARPR